MLFCLIIAGSLALAQNQDSSPKPTDAQNLALKLANPLASMISVPFQFNVMVGVGEYNGSQLITNFQPVIPIRLGKVNIITRTDYPRSGLIRIGPADQAMAEVRQSMD
jgi:hypothetical protein